MKYRKTHLIKKTIAVLLMLLGILSIIGAHYFSRYLRPRIVAISQSYAKNTVSNIIDKEVKKLMLKEFLSYDKIAVINRDNNGRVTSVSTNSVLINNFANDLDIAIGNELSSEDIIENKVYLFGLIGSEIFAGMGPKIPIRYQSVSVTDADIRHTFEETGINQTLHTIILKISIDIEIILPLAYSTVTVVSEMPIAQTLIVGTVPNAYYKK